MDAVELSYPVDVAVPAKLTGSDDIGGGRIQGKEVSEASVVPVRESSSIEPCSVPIERKGAAIVKDTVEPSSPHGLLDSQQSSQVSLAKLQDEPASNPLNSGCVDFRSPGSHGEVSELHKKTGKMSRSSSGPSKRQKVTLSEVVRLPEMNGLNDMSGKQLLCHAKYNGGDKTQTMKQKNPVSGKRGDKRNPRAPARTMANLCSATGENNFFGFYGLKPDINDVTKLVDDIALNELLDGTYRCLRVGQVKEKKAVCSNEAFMNSVRKACSALAVARPVQSHDSCDNAEQGDICMPDTSSSDDHQDNKCENSANPFDSSIREPKLVLEQLALPPRRDLESLLQDASKPPQNIRNSFDQRLGKQLSRRVTLPSFPWSNAFNWHAKANSEAVKLLTSRTPCQGHWARIENSLCSPAAISNALSDLELFTFDQSLVPSQRKPGTKGQEFPSSFCGRLSCCKCSANTTTHDKVLFVSTGSGVELKARKNDGQCPKLLAAAQTLCDMATKSLKQNANGVMRWPKKVSQKAMRACKSKSLEKSKDTAISTLTFASGPDNHVSRGGNEAVTPPKRPKLSPDTSKLGLSHIVPRKNGLNSWHSSRLEKPSASILAQDTAVEGRNLYMSNIKQSCLTRQSFRVSDKVSSSRKKLRKLLPTDWDQGREKQE